MFRFLLINLMVSSISASAALGDEYFPNSQTITSKIPASKTPARQAYFGDLHIHSSLSLDAFVGGNRRMPDDVYRFAKGEPMNIGGKIIVLRQPLDFAAVTDHAEYLSESYSVQTPAAPNYQAPLAKKLRSLASTEDMRNFFKGMIKNKRAGKKLKHLPLYSGEPVLAKAWQLSLDAAQQHYQPGRFTTLAGFEWSAVPNGANLHRNVIFRDMNVPKTPTSYIESENEQQLWQWMLDAQKDGSQVLAIPHNSNGSKGQMFSDLDGAGRPITAEYAKLRQQLEPLIEIHQVKANSEVHPGFWKNDEFSGFENGKSMARFSGRSAQANNYVRYGLKSGLAHAQRLGVNPFKYGIIAGTDTHNSNAGNTAEDNWQGGSHGVIDADAKSRATETVDGWITTLDTNPGGLTGVWADDNRREAIWDALKRREAFGTSGSRIQLRMFAGWDYPMDMHEKRDAIVLAYQQGVAMGQDLNPKAKMDAPRIMVSASRDPNSAPLQRVQIIKGWLDSAGEMQEIIYDVACADGLKPDPNTRRCPSNNAAVDLTNCAYPQNKGAAELSAVWRDPDFNPAVKSFYYARALENPSCRWSSWDAVRNGWAKPVGAPATVQERAWGSPVWYSPYP